MVKVTFPLFGLWLPGVDSRGHLFPLVTLSKIQRIGAEFGVVFLPCPPDSDPEWAFSKERMLGCGYYFIKIEQYQTIPSPIKLNWDPGAVDLRYADQLDLNQYIRSFLRTVWLEPESPIDYSVQLLQNKQIIKNYFGWEYHCPSYGSVSWGMTFRVRESNQLYAPPGYNTGHNTIFASGAEWRRIFIPSGMLIMHKHYPQPWRLAKNITEGMVFAIPTDPGFSIGQVLGHAFLTHEGEKREIGFYYVFFAENFESLDEAREQNVQRLTPLAQGLGWAMHLDYDLWKILGVQPLAIPVHQELKDKEFSGELVTSTLLYHNLIRGYLKLGAWHKNYIPFLAPGKKPPEDPISFPQKPQYSIGI